MPTLYAKTYNSDEINQHYLQRLVYEPFFLWLIYIFMYWAVLKD